MADLRKTIEIIFAGIDNTGGAISSVGSNISALASSVESATQPLADATDLILKVNTAIAALGAAALGFSINEAVKFESAQLELQKVLGDTEGSVDQYTDQILDLSTQFGISATDVTASAANFRQANFDIAESFDLVEQALTAANISELSAAEASDILARSLAGFGAGAEDASRLLDIFNEVSNNANATVGELGAGFAQLSPVANQLGLSFEETVALLTPIVEVFGSGSEAARALRTGFARLIDPTKEIRETLDQVGITQRDVNGEFLNGLPLFREVQDEFGNLTSKEQQLVAEAIAGANQLARFSIALSNTNREAEILALSASAAGSSIKELEIRLQATEVSISRFVVGVQNSAIAVGKQFLPETKDAFDALTVLTSAFQDVIASGGLAPLFEALRPLFTEFSATVEAIAANLDEAFTGLDFGPFVGALGDLGTAISNIFGGLDLRTAEGLQQALQTIVNIGAGLVRTTEGIVEAFAPFLQALADGAIAASELDGDTQSLIGRILGFGKTVNTIAPFVGSLGSAVEGLGDAIVILASAKVLGAVIPSLDGLSATAKSLTSVLGKAGLVGAVGAVSYELTSLVVESDTGQKAMLGLGNIIDDLTGQTDKANESLGKMSFTAADFGEKITEAGRNTEELISKIQEGAEPLVDPFEDGVLSVEEMTQAIELYGNQWDLIDGKAVPTIEWLNEKTAENEQLTSGMVKTVEGGVTTFEQFGTAAGTAFEEAEKSAEKAKKKSDEYLLKMEEIASNERIKKIEALVDLNVAQVEADAQKIESIIEGLNNSFSSTGDVISSALGALGSAEGFFGLEKLELIEEQIAFENKLRQETFELQKRQTEATIEEIRARTQALQQGDGLIQISADGLEPELEAFMFEILKRVQVRANESASEFLLGLG